MTMNPLPPQAYTKDTLLKAYQWLMAQNTSIKEMATNPEILVSLYLKATRDGDSALDRPSILNFKNELKSLAGMMTELDRKGPASHPNKASSAPLLPSSQNLSSQPESVPEEKPASPHPAPPPPVPEFKTPHIQFEEPSKNSSALLTESLDNATLCMIREVKADFNLSNEVEALRMLVKVGYVRAKGFLQP